MLEPYQGEKCEAARKPGSRCPSEKLCDVSNDKFKRQWLRIFLNHMKFQCGSISGATESSRARTRGSSSISACRIELMRNHKPTQSSTTSSRSLGQSHRPRSRLWRVSNTDQTGHRNSARLPKRWKSLTKREAGMGITVRSVRARNQQAVR